jgi:hypothetical protein
VQGWLLLRKQERRLLRLLKRGPERMSLRVQGRTLLRAQARRPLRQPERWLVRDEDRVRFRVQVLNRNQVLLGYEYRRPVRGPVMGPERWLLQRPERMPFPTLLRAPEQRRHKGQELPQRSGE